MPCNQRRRKHRRGAGACPEGASGISVPQAAQAPLPDPVVQALDLALADERQALATYQAVLKRFGDIRPFVNIAQAEQRHIAALLSIYRSYRAPVPDAEISIDPVMHTLDIPDLCRIGVAAEIENARLYDEELLPAVAAYPDISSVLRALRDASANNHLPAFERCVSRSGHRAQDRK